MSQLSDHKLASIFPIMANGELRELADDIRENGLRDSIWIFEGAILDGRNRYRACQLAEVAPRTQEYKGKDPLAFVLSKNLHRRHLTESQRAMVAAEIANIQHGENLNQGSRAANLPLGKTTQKQASEMLGVSERTVRDAVAVKDEGVPELADAVKSGEVPVSTAAKVAKLPKAQQRKAVKAGPKAVKAAAKKATEAKPEPVADEPTASDDDASEVFCKQVNTLCTDIDALVARIEALKESPYGRFVHVDSAVSQLRGARSTLWGGRPTHDCPYCNVAGETQPNCRCCRGLGVTTKSSYRAGVAAVGDGK